MAANRPQGPWVLTFSIGCGVVPAGLIALAGRSLATGVVVLMVGIALVAQSIAGFRRIKRLEFKRD
ncbi:MAG: hypothetical protein ACRD18_07455 [Terriglobia bacterium]